jgi:hypothetical protein
MLVDGGFVDQTEIETLSTTHCGMLIYAPPRRPSDPRRDPHVPRSDDPPAVAAWRIRMGTPAGQAIYRERAATAECVNAIARNRGLLRIPVRGLAKARAVLLWFALAHNLLRTVALRRAADVGAGG